MGGRLKIWVTRRYVRKREVFEERTLGFIGFYLAEKRKIEAWPSEFACGVLKSHFQKGSSLFIRVDSGLINFVLAAACQK